MVANEKNRMVKGAVKIISECLGVKAGEQLVVLVDQPNEAVGDVLREAGLKAGAEVSLMVMVPRRAHAEDPPRPIARALQAADAAVLAASFSLSNSEARRQANQAGARVISLPGCTEETLVRGAIEADFAFLKPRIEQLGTVLTQGKEIRITSRAGTHLTVRLCGRKSVDQTATAVEPGSWAPAPNLETAVGPAEDGVDGLFVVDGVTIPGGVPAIPVEVELQRGRITEIRGGEHADRLRDYLSSFAHPALYQVVEVGIGLNPCSRLGLGLMAEDESKLGTVHLGFGEGRTFGLPISAPSHVDLVMRYPTVEVDGRQVVREEIVDPSFGFPEVME